MPRWRAHPSICTWRGLPCRMLWPSIRSEPTIEQHPARGDYGLKRRRVPQLICRRSWSGHALGAGNQNQPMVVCSKESSFISAISTSLPRSDCNSGRYAGTNLVVDGNVDSLGYFKGCREPIGHGFLHPCCIFSAVDLNRQGVAISERDSHFTFKYFVLDSTSPYCLPVGILSIRDQCSAFNFKPQACGSIALGVCGKRR